MVLTYVTAAKRLFITMNKEKILKYLKWFFNSFIWLGVLLLFLDILSKNLVIANKEEILSKGGIVLIPNFLRINYVINENIAFGISLGSALATQIVFSILAIIIVGVIIFFLAKKWDNVNKFYRACFMMIIAGAIGNVIDRLFYSASYLDMGGATGVVDWIDFYTIWGFNFNIADSAVVVAAFMLIIYMVIEEIMEYVKNKPAREKMKAEEDDSKVLSKTELEKQKLLEESKENNDPKDSDNK